MRIRSNVVPTPIVSMPQAAPEPQPAPVPAAAVETEPLVVDLGGKKLELQPGELAKIVEKMNQTAQVFHQSLQFEMGQGMNVVIRVIDTVSGQVVREIPPEKFVDAFSRMEDELGLLLDLKV